MDSRTNTAKKLVFRFIIRPPKDEAVRCTRAIAMPLQATDPNNIRVQATQLGVKILRHQKILFYAPPSLAVNTRVPVTDRKSHLTSGEGLASNRRLWGIRRISRCVSRKITYFTVWAPVGLFITLLSSTRQTPLSSRCQSLGTGTCSPSRSALLPILYWARKHKIQRERDLAVPALRLSSSQNSQLERRHHALLDANVPGDSANRRGSGFYRHSVGGGWYREAVVRDFPGVVCDFTGNPSHAPWNRHLGGQTRKARRGFSEKHADYKEIKL